VSYILGSLAGSNNAALDGLIAQFSAQLLPLVKSAIAQNFTRYQAYNLFRFNISDIKSTRDTRLKTLTKDDKNDFPQGATAVYKAFYAACRVATGVMKATTKPKNPDVNDVAFDVWKMIWAQITPEVPADVKLDKKTAPAEDNTMLYVAGAAAVALVAYGASRRKGS
jgi:hypothetical protein